MGQVIGLHENAVALEVWQGDRKIADVKSFSKAKRDYNIKAKAVHLAIGKPLESNKGIIILKYKKQTK